MPRSFSIDDLREAVRRARSRAASGRGSVAREASRAAGAAGFSSGRDAGLRTGREAARTAGAAGVRVGAAEARSVGRDAMSRATGAAGRVIEGLETDLAGARARDVRHTSRAMGIAREGIAAAKAMDMRHGKKAVQLLRKLATKNKKLAIGTAIAVPVAGALTYGAGLLRGRQGVKAPVTPPKFEDIKIPGRSMLPYQQDENYSDSGGGQRYVTRSEQYAPREQQAPAPQAQSSGGGSYRVSSGERSSLTQTMRNQQKAVRDTKSYLGEAFDATIRKGVTAGRKHLANMLERDGLDQDQGDRIMRKYDSEIGNQTSLKDFKDKGVIDDYESRNPGKGKALLAAYRGRYPAGTTMSEMKAAANASRS